MTLWCYHFKCTVRYKTGSDQQCNANLNATLYAVATGLRSRIVGRWRRNKRPKMLRPHLFPFRLGFKYKIQMMKICPKHSAAQQHVQNFMQIV